MGKTVESYKYTGVRPNDTKNIKQMKKHIANELKRMKKKRSLSYLKELIDPLISKGLLTKEIKQSNNKYRVSLVDLFCCNILSLTDSVRAPVVFCDLQNCLLQDKIHVLEG
jgi:hypothetical protein